jgi:hypothetical protein
MKNNELKKLHELILFNGFLMHIENIQKVHLTQEKQLKENLDKTDATLHELMGTDSHKIYFLSGFYSSQCD